MGIFDVVVLFKVLVCWSGGKRKGVHCHGHAGLMIFAQLACIFSHDRKNHFLVFMPVSDQFG